MPKLRYTPRALIPRSPEMDDAGHWDGNGLADGTVAPSKMTVEELDQLTRALGTLRTGSIILGANEAGLGRRFAIGDVAYGLRAYNQSERLWLAFDWRDESGRIGLVGGPGIDILGGLVTIHGSLIVDETITAAKIRVGRLGKTLLEDGRILVGTGVWGTNFSGLALLENLAGGYKNQTAIWTVDNATGDIVLTDSAEPTRNYARLHGGGVIIANEMSFASGFVPDAALTFRNYGFDDIEWYNYDAQMFMMDDASINIKTSANVYRPSLVLSSFDQSEWAVLAPDHISMQSAHGGYDLTLGGRASYLVDTDVDTMMGEIRIGPYAIGVAYPMVGVGLDGFNLYNAVLRWKNFTGGNVNRSFPERPEEPAADEMMIRPDPENHCFEGWTGTEWKPFAWA
jgi:hypothetical protein